MADRVIVQMSHNAADGRIPLSRSLLHGSRLHGVPNAAPLYRARNAAELPISYDLAHIPDILNGGVVKHISRNAADRTVPFDCALIVGILNPTLVF